MNDCDSCKHKKGVQVPCTSCPGRECERCGRTIYRKSGHQCPKPKAEKPWADDLVKSVSKVSDFIKPIYGFENRPVPKGRVLQKSSILLKIEYVPDQLCEHDCEDHEHLEYLVCNLTGVKTATAVDGYQLEKMQKDFANGFDTKDVADTIMVTLSPELVEHADAIKAEVNKCISGMEFPSL